MEHVWDSYVGDTDSRARAEVLKRLGREEAALIVGGVPSSTLPGPDEQSVVSALIERDVLSLRKERLFFRHDLIGDWARLLTLIEAGESPPGSYPVLMPAEFPTTPVSVTLLGLCVPHDPLKTYAQEFLALLARVWPILKANSIPNPGINWAVYDAGGGVFAGVETREPDAHNPSTPADPAALGLELKPIHLTHYAQCLHVGPYRDIPTTGAELNRAIITQGHRPAWPLIEIYGHYTPDETKLETLILRAIT